MHEHEEAETREDVAIELPADWKPTIRRKSVRENIKRIHIQIGKKRTTMSMDATLHYYLKARLSEQGGQSVRQWTQERIDELQGNGSAKETVRTSSLSRRVQALAIHVIAKPSS